MVQHLRQDSPVRDQPRRMARNGLRTVQQLQVADADLAWVVREGADEGGAARGCSFHFAMSSISKISACSWMAIPFRIFSTGLHVDQPEANPSMSWICVRASFTRISVRA